MPPSPGARLDGLFPTEPAHIPSIAEEKAWKNQLAASDGGRAADPTQGSLHGRGATETFKSNARAKPRPTPSRRCSPARRPRDEAARARAGPSTFAATCRAATATNSPELSRGSDPALEAGAVLDPGATTDGTMLDRRTALRSVARDVESLMLISEALSAKEMPVLAKRLKEGLSRIKENARTGTRRRVSSLVSNPRWRRSAA